MLNIESFEKKFLDKFKIDEQTECWNWTGKRDKFGYGVIIGKAFRDKHQISAYRMSTHRVSWIIHNGQIPSGGGYHGMCVLHRCDNPSCINPSHLMLGSSTENMMDKTQKGRAITNNSWIKRHQLSLSNAEIIEKVKLTPGSNADLAKLFGCARSTISRIRSGKHHANLK